jgi:hypothetical protein
MNNKNLIANLLETTEQTISIIETQRYNILRSAKLPKGFGLTYIAGQFIFFKHEDTSIDVRFELENDKLEMVLHDKSLKIFEIEECRKSLEELLCLK